MMKRDCKHLNRYKTYTKDGDISYTYDCKIVTLGDAECLINCDKYEVEEFDKDIELLADQMECFMKSMENGFCVTDANGRKALNIDNSGNVHINSDIKTDNDIKPSHYNSGKTDIIAFCFEHNVPFWAGNVIKYVFRAGKKDKSKEIQDLNKAIEYIKRRIEYLEGE